jgi:hypothetical protein
LVWRGGGACVWGGVDGCEGVGGWGGGGEGEGGCGERRELVGWWRAQV